MRWFRRRRAPRSASEAPTSWSAPENPEWTHPDRWRLDSWDRPDLSYADAHAVARYQGWECYVPNLELVQCGDTAKPALFFKIGYAEYDDWATAVEPTTIGWTWYRTKGATPYVVIDFHVLFANGNRRPLGMGGAGQITLTTAESDQYAHQLRSRTLLDPGNHAHRAVIEAWVAGPAPTMLFFVEENFRATSYLSMDIGPSTKQDLLRILSEASEELSTEGIVPGSFPDACALLREHLPAVSWWQ